MTKKIRTFITFFLLIGCFTSWSMVYAAEDSSDVRTLSPKIAQLQPVPQTSDPACTYSSSGDAMIYGNDPVYTARGMQTNVCPTGMVAVRNNISVFINAWVSAIDYYSDKERRDVVRSFGVAVGVLCCPIVNVWKTP